MLVALALLAGCNGNMEALQKDLKDVRARLDDVARTGTAARGRIDDIDNRVLLLQDEVETQKMAGMRGVRGAPVAAAAPTPVSAPANLPVTRIEPPDDRDDDRAVATRAAPGSGRAAAPASLDDPYQDIDENGRVLPSKGGRSRDVAAPAPAAARPRPKAATRGASDDPELLSEYKAAYSMYEQGRTEEARASFDAFAVAHPRHPYADNARYWVGECLYDARDFEGARREFMRVIRDHPDGNKVPDAMVKVALCDQMLRQPEDARRMFDAVMLTYPDSQAAAVAMRLLGEMP